MTQDEFEVSADVGGRRISVEGTTREWTNVRVASLELLSCFGSFGAVKLVGELPGHEVRLGDHTTRPYLMMGSMELVRKTGLGGGDGGRESNGLAGNRDERILLEQPAVGTGVQAGGVLGAGVVSGRISSLTNARPASTG